VSFLGLFIPFTIVVPWSDVQFAVPRSDVQFWENVMGVLTSVGAERVWKDNGSQKETYESIEISASHQLEQLMNGLKNT